MESDWFPRQDPWPHAAAAHTRQPCTFRSHMLKIIATTCLDTFPRTGRSGGLPRLPSALLEGGVPHNRGGIVTDLRIYYYYYVKVTQTHAGQLSPSC